MMIPVALKASVTVEVHRGVIRSKSRQAEALVMKSCVATAFVFVLLLVLGVF